MQIKTIYYFGNEYIKEDSLAIKVTNTLKKEFQKIDFKHLTNTFQLVDLDLSSSLLLDVADVPKVMLIDSSKTLPGGLTTAHDFDIGFILRITEKPAEIIAIPKDYDENNAIKEVRPLVNSLMRN